MMSSKAQRNVKRFTRKKGAENACVAAATETVEEIFKVHAFFTMVAQEAHRQSPTERQGKQRKDIGDIRK